MNDLLLHATASALWMFLGGEVCEKHFSDYRTACLLSSAAMVMGAGAVKEELIDERRQGKDYAGDAIGVVAGFAVRF